MQAPSPPASAIPPEVFERAGWRFECAAAPLWQSSRIDALAADEGLCKVPDMFCGDALLRISHGASNTVLEFGAREALRCCKWPAPEPAAQPPPQDSAGVVGVGGDAGEAGGPWFGAVQCQFADRWRPKGDNPDVKELVVSSDWTCSSPYWGLCRQGGAAGGPVAEATDEELPMELLRRRDEIHWYQELLFWEDELDDNGVCRLSLRVRVMPGFWFVLLLCELRVDNVLIREVGTRYFCSFDAQHVLREWTWKEATCEALRARGVLKPDSPHISQASVGTQLLEQADIRLRHRHRLLLGSSCADEAGDDQGKQP